MRKRKVILVSLTLLTTLVVVCLVAHSNRPALSWRVVAVHPHQNYFAVDRIQECWRVDIEVSNTTSDEVIVDWNRDKSAFKMGDRWENLGIAALMPYLPPNESRTFPVYVPQQAQACRLLMHYERGPLWSSVDGFLKGRNIYLSDRLFSVGMKWNRKFPGHFKQLEIEVTLPPNQGAAANRRPAGQSDGSDNLSATLAADRAFPAAVAELDR
jgi:hypothetical protein